MWTREYLKNRAKAVLRVSYWKALVVSLILGVAASNGGGGSSGFDDLVESLSPQEAMIVLLIVVFFVFLALAFRIFIGYHLEVGGRRFFVQNAQLEGISSEELSVLGYVFNKERYMDVVKAHAL
ncbi:hypothetical protein [Acetivibrio straminisolvens]|jgi:hypothetical protein|uniref:Uncharacterized protein n=1 Tax=Acetivibrio straminisolvens JCM 21531 TaxID=1294263 RepID=W4V6L6_9FIRM|nr:hypothetical protein JCM21531_1886 [Acetivibrio straminisolvens JCM 21531]